MLFPWLRTFRAPSKGAVCRGLGNVEVRVANCEFRSGPPITDRVDIPEASEELKWQTKTFALDVIRLCSRLPQTRETRHAVGQVICSSSSTAANYRSACREKSKADFISKLATVEEEADESGFWLEMLRHISQLGIVEFDSQSVLELGRLEDEVNQLLAITVASKKTARST